MKNALTPTTGRKARTFTPNAELIAKRQYMQPGEEKIHDIYRRTARWVAGAETENAEKHEEAFFELLASGVFSPGGRVYAGAGTLHGNGLNCFVQDGNPHQEGTTDYALLLARKLALVTKVGGGNGLNLDVFPPKRAHNLSIGQASITITPDHPDFENTKAGRFMDLSLGDYQVKPYEFLAFVQHDTPTPDGAVLINVEDSIEGIWDAAADMVRHLLNNTDVHLDFSNLRAEGTPVKGSGGTSSGPSSFAVEIFENFARWANLGGAEYAGPVATLRYLYATTLRVVKQGGSRRGAGMATLSATHPDLQDFINSKDLAREAAEGDISTFNISVLASNTFMDNAMKAIKADGDNTQDPDGQALLSIAHHAWNTGEPGLIFIDVINEFNPMLETMGPIKSTNPCVPGDTWVMTDQGARQVSELIGTPFTAIVNGKQYPVTSDGFWSTGVKPLLKVTTKRGFELRVTGNHKLRKITDEAASWVEAENLLPGDHLELQDHHDVPSWVGAGTFAEGWLVGSSVGHRTTLVPVLAGNTELAPQHEIRFDSLHSRYGITQEHTSITSEIERASNDFYRGFLRGLFDAHAELEGEENNGVTIRITNTDSNLLRGIQRMLARLGILSSVNTNDLIITGMHTQRYANLIHFDIQSKAANLDTLLEQFPTNDTLSFADEILDISIDGEEEVFDVTVAEVHAFDANGLTAHNCGEIPLFAGEPCDLGALNLSEYVTTLEDGTATFNHDALAADTHTAIRFLDNVLDVNNFALEENRDMSHKLRRLGLGIMGLADALIKLGIRYDTQEGRETTTSIINTMRDAAIEASENLAVERGTFPAFEDSSITTPRRNVAVLTVAPTGTTSMLLDASGGVEPVFAATYTRRIGTDYVKFIHPLLNEILNSLNPNDAPTNRFVTQDGKWDEEALTAALNEHHGSIQPLLADLPEDSRLNAFLIAHDIPWAGHVLMQSAIQTAFDNGDYPANSISKTINMANDATPQDVLSAYQLAYETGSKGITVYRDGSRQFQVLTTGDTKKKDDKPATQEPSMNTEATTPTPSASTPAVTQGAPTSLKPQKYERPQRMTGITDRVELHSPNTGASRSFFITVNSNGDQKPREVFIISGKGGDEANGDSEALGRLTSIALQYGVPAEALIKTLRGISGGMYGTYQGSIVTSKADLIATALEGALGTKVAKSRTNSGNDCPVCEGELAPVEGCLTCMDPSCGWSACS